MAERLRVTLDERGVSQSELARRLAGSRASVRRVESVRRQVVRWCNGQAAPSEASAHRLAKVLEMPDDAFVTMAEVRTLDALREIQQVADRFASIESRLGELEQRLADRMQDFQVALDELRSARLASEHQRPDEK